MAGALARQGKPHFVEIQGAQYEGLTVWFNTLINSAGGSILNATATAPSLGPPAVRAAGIMRNLAKSPAADPSLPLAQTWHWGQRNDERPLNLTRTIVLRHRRHASPSRS